MYIGRRGNITHYLHALHWLRVEHRIQYKAILLTFKSLHDLAPSYLKELLRPYHDTSRRNESGLLVVPRTRRAEAGARAFEHVAPVLWNALPVELRTESNIISFKKLLETVLFKNAFPNF